MASEYIPRPRKKVLFVQLSQLIQLEEKEDGKYHVTVIIPPDITNRLSFKMFIEGLQESSKRGALGLKYLALPEKKYNPDIGRKVVEKRLKRRNIMFPEAVKSAVEYMERKEIDKETIRRFLIRVMTHLLELQNHEDPHIAEIAKTVHKALREDEELKKYLRVDERESSWIREFSSKIGKRPSEDSRHT